MSVETSDVDDRVLNLVGGGSAVMHLVVFTVIGELVLENVAYGAIVGLFAGGGAYLFLPWFLRVSAALNEASDDVAPADAVRRAGGTPRLSVLGLGFELGGIAMFAVGLALDEATLVYGVLVAVIVALVVYLVGSVLLNRQAT